MSSNKFSRRDFNKLSLAALGGALSGASLIGCNGQASKGAPAAGGAAASETHVCRGLNNCKGQGAGGGNACAGQGKCSTAKAHSCKGQNDCKNLGGCGETPGQNACKGQGGCAVPLADHAWGKARANFETAMKNANKQFGAAPAKA